MSPIQRHGRTLMLVMMILVFSVGTVLPLAAEVTMDVQSNLWFEGTSTVRDWACKDVPTANGTLTLPDRPESNEDLMALLSESSDNLVRTALGFPAKSIKCEKGETMNKHLRNALEAKKYPEVEFQLQGLSEVASVNDGDTLQARARGDLTVKETTKSVEIPIRANVTENGSITVTGTMPMDITEYGVTPPTVMWTITVYDNITIHTNFQLSPEE